MAKDKKGTSSKGSKNTPAKREEPANSVAKYDADDLGAGFEDFTRDDLAIPFINILQKMSPAVDPDSPNHIDKAKAGMMINSVTQELYDGKEDGVVVIPVHRVHQFIEWVPRDAGGGFVAAHEVDDPMIVEAKKGGNFGKLESPDGNDLVETFNVYVLLVGDDGDYQPAVIPFSSTNIKAYKKWMTNARSIVLKDEEGRRFPAPMFSHKYRILTQFQENNKGTWHAFRVAFAEGDAESSRLAPEDELYQAAKGVRELVLSGAAKPNYDSAAAHQTDDADDDGDDEKPF